MGNINDNYFDGSYKDVWKALIPEILTVKETEFLLQYFNLQRGQRVLDLMCGYGRHTLALARNGLDVTAVDNLESYIDELQRTIDLESLPARGYQADILTYTPGNGQYDLALCMGNSLNFFNKEESIRILSNIKEALQPAGHLVINTWSLAEIAYRQFVEKSEGQTAGIKIVSDSRFCRSPSRIESTTLMELQDGTIETKPAVDYIFSINEMEDMLSAAGLSLMEIYSIPGRKKFTLGDPRAYLVAQKIPR